LRSFRHNEERDTRRRTDRAGDDGGSIHDAVSTPVSQPADLTSFVRPFQSATHTHFARLLDEATDDACG
jgi:hypothetical protein